MKFTKSIYNNKKVRKIGRKREVRGQIENKYQQFLNIKSHCMEMEQTLHLISTDN